MTTPTITVLFVLAVWMWLIIPMTYGKLSDPREWLRMRPTELEKTVRRIADTYDFTMTDFCFHMDIDYMTFDRWLMANPWRYRRLSTLGLRKDQAKLKRQFAEMTDDMSVVESKITRAIKGDDK